jgi:1-acyl-sn-glycerol-3-phosphate acyltransferase
MRWLGKFLMKITGWKTTGHLPKDERVVLIAGPHTSNWDFVLADVADFKFRCAYPLGWKAFYF